MQLLHETKEVRLLSQDELPCYDLGDAATAANHGRIGVRDYADGCQGARHAGRHRRQILVPEGGIAAGPCQGRRAALLLGLARRPQVVQ